MKTKIFSKAGVFTVLTGLVVLITTASFIAQSKDDGGKKPKSKSKSVIIKIEDDDKKMTITTVEDGKKTIERYEGDAVDEYLKKNKDKDAIIHTKDGEDEVIITKSKIIARSRGDSTSAEEVIINWDDALSKTSEEMERAAREVEDAIHRVMKEIDFDSIMKNLDIDIDVKDKKDGKRIIIDIH